MEKILICVNEFKNFYLFRQTLINELSQRYKVILVGKFDGYEERFSDKFKVLNLKIKSNQTNPIHEIRTLLSLFQIILKHRPKYILTFTVKPNIYVGLILKIYTKPKQVVNITGLGTSFITSKTLGSFISFLYKISFSEDSHFLFQNSEDFLFFHKKKIVKKSQCSLIPGSGISPNPENPKKTINPIRKFLFAGRLIIDKGILEFIQATTDVNSKNIKEKVEFHIVGKYDIENPRSLDKGTLDKWEKMSNCFYHGELLNLENVLHNYDVIVLPSYREGLSKVLLEAGNNGIPIITTNTPGCKELIQNDNGLLVKATDKESLKTALIELIKKSDEELLRMGNNGYEYITSKYNVSEVISIYISILNEK